MIDEKGLFVYQCHAEESIQCKKQSDFFYFHEDGKTALIEKKKIAICNANAAKPCPLSEKVEI